VRQEYVLLLSWCVCRGEERRSRVLAVRGIMCIWAGKTVIEAITAHDVREAEGRSSHDIPAVLKDVSQAEHLTPCSAPAQLRQRYTRQLNSSQYIKHQHTNMPYFTSSEEWQKQSALLLQARPNTVCAAPLPQPSPSPSFPLPPTTHLFLPCLTSHISLTALLPLLTLLTDTYNNQIPHPLRLFNLDQTHNHHRRPHRIKTRAATNRLPRTKNLRPNLRHDSKIQNR